MRLSSSARQALKVAVIFCVCLLAACASKKSAEDQRSGVIVVNAPATGEVRRVLVSEGAQVSAGTPIVEIAVQDQSQAAAPSPSESAESKAVRGVKSAQSEIEAARAEVVRHQAEVDRLTPLVAAGQASQPQLDGERALYEKAQQRLQKAQAAEQQAETELRVAREPGAQGMTTQSPTLREQTVVAPATSGGTVAVISVRVGDRVKSGQPLATLRADAP